MIGASIDEAVIEYHTCIKYASASTVTAASAAVVAATYEKYIANNSLFFQPFCY